MSISFILTIQLFVSASCLLEGPNVCVDNERKYCCSEHEEKNGECVACKLGFTSLDGQLCKPCGLGRYGKRCILACKCSDSQRCHHIYGCNMDDLSTETINDDKTVSITSQAFNLNFSEIDRNGKRISKTSLPFDVNSSDIVKNELSKMDLKIYSATVTGVVGTCFVIGFVYICRRFTKTFQENKSSASTGFVNSTNEIVEINEEIYHTIDEIDIVPSDNADTYLEAVNGSSNSEGGVTNSEPIEGSYPHPYIILIETREIHTYDECQQGNKVISEETIVEENISHVEALTPYAWCLDAQRKDSNYELQSIVVVHAADTSSSEYESEKDESDSSGYLNPLIDSDNASLVYDISISGPNAKANLEAKT